MAEFKGVKHTLPATYDNCVEIIKLAKEHHITQTKIAEKTNLNSAQLSGFMRGKDIYKKSRIQALLADYFSKERQELIDRLYELTNPRNSRKRELETSFQHTFDFAVPLYRFFDIRDVSSDLRDLRPAFYVCYKRSQRFRSEANYDERRIVKSILMVRPTDDRSKFLFEDNQLDRDRGHEVTHGVVFSSSQNIFLFGKEISRCQPRLFWLAIRRFAADEDNMGGAQYIQIMIGFCFEGYARYPNPDNYPRGCFFSTIGLQRIPESEINEIVKTEYEDLDNLTPWSDKWITHVRNGLVKRAEILDDIDLPETNEITQHFRKTPYWINSYYQMQKTSFPEP